MAIISSTRLERREGACKNCLLNTFTYSFATLVYFLGVLEYIFVPCVKYMCLMCHGIFACVEYICLKCWIYLWRHIVWGGADCEIALILSQAENEIFSVLSYNKFSALSCYIFGGNKSKYNISQDFSAAQHLDSGIERIKNKRVDRLKSWLNMKISNRHQNIPLKLPL